jgi:hypothetical protein
VSRYSGAASRMASTSSRCRCLDRPASIEVVGAERGGRASARCAQPAATLRAQERSSRVELERDGRERGRPALPASRIGKGRTDVSVLRSGSALTLRPGRHGLICCDISRTRDGPSLFQVSRAATRRSGWAATESRLAVRGNPPAGRVRCAGIPTRRRGPLERRCPGPTPQRCFLGSTFRCPFEDTRGRPRGPREHDRTMIESYAEVVTVYQER